MNKAVMHKAESAEGIEKDSLVRSFCCLVHNGKHSHGYPNLNACFGRRGVGKNSHSNGPNNLQHRKTLFKSLANKLVVVLLFKKKKPTINKA